MSIDVMNEVTIKHQFDEAIDEIEEMWAKELMFNSLKPQPHGLERNTAPCLGTYMGILLGKLDYDKLKLDVKTWKVTEWGCSSEPKYEYGEIKRVNRKELWLKFDTPYAPPIKIFDELSNRDYKVDAYFSGIESCGFYDNGETHYFKLDHLIKEFESNGSYPDYVPEELRGHVEWYRLND